MVRGNVVDMMMKWWWKMAGLLVRQGGEAGIGKLLLSIVEY